MDAGWAAFLAAMIGMIGLLLGIIVSSYLENERAKRDRYHDLRLRLTGDKFQTSEIMAYIELKRKRRWLKFWQKPIPDLSHGHLQEVDLRNQNLRGVVFFRANFLKADLDDANLQEADLCKSDLREASLQNVNLQKANLKKALLGTLPLALNTSEEAEEPVSSWPTDLFRADLSEANLQEVKFKNSILSEANLTKANLRGASLVGTNMRQAVLVNADLTFAYLKETLLVEADLRKADLGNAYLVEVSLHGADLREANLEKTRLKNVRYSSETKWPEGFEPEEEDVRLEGFTHKATS